MLNTAIKAAQTAGTFLLENFGKVQEIIVKGDRNLATEIDRKAEEIIVGEITSKYPSHGILAEEQAKNNLENEWLWIIDPLDGTHNFIRHIDIFGVSIGLVHNGEFVAGVIYMPRPNEMYAGEQGSGAYKNGKRISVSKTADLKKCSVSFDSSIRYNPQTMLSVLGKVSQEVFNVRMLGSSARLLSYVAEGTLDFAIEFHDLPWDFAGGVCLIREAGGVFTDLAGGRPTPKTIGYIASNETLHSRIQSAFFD